MRYHADSDLRMVCSEPLAGYAFHDVPRNGVMVL